MSAVMLFNPFNGTPRHPDDIKSDPSGVLVWNGDEPLPVSRTAGTVLAYKIDTGFISQAQLYEMRHAIECARYAHRTNIVTQINGRDAHWQADWLKHFKEQP